MGRIFSATGATILGSCGFKDDDKGFSVKLGANWFSSEWFGFVGHLFYLIT